MRENASVKFSLAGALSILLAGGIPPSAGAQGTQPQRQRLTVTAALDVANRQNLELAAARAHRAVALAGVRAAGQRPNPSLTFAATRDEPHESSFMDLPLEIGSKRSKRIELAKQQVALTDVDISALERHVRMSVRIAYYGLALARGSTQERAEALKLGDRLRDIARARFEAGDIPRLEVTQAELEVAREQADFQVAQQEEKVALSELNALMNEPSLMDWDVGEAFAAVPPSLTLEELLARSGASSTEILRIGQEQKVQQTQTALFRAQRIPNLGLQFGADFNSPHDFDVGARGQISMELPILNRYQGEIAGSLATENALQQELAATRRSVDARVEAAYFDLTARLLQAELYHDTLVPSSRKLEDLAEDSYRSGKANILIVLTAQREVQQVGQEYLNSVHAVQTAFAQLEEAVGAPLE
jgi:cobalt-zinc-cadmium efflux system outer membrane protein